MNSFCPLPGGLLPTPIERESWGPRAKAPPFARTIYLNGLLRASLPDNPPLRPLHLNGLLRAIYVRELKGDCREANFILSRG